VFGTLVKLELSGEVWKVTVVASVPVVVKVIRQLTHGVWLLKLETPVCVASPCAVKVKVQSGWAAAGKAPNTATIKSRRGRALIGLVMPLILHLRLVPVWCGYEFNPVYFQSRSWLSWVGCSPDSLAHFRLVHLRGEGA